MKKQTEIYVEGIGNLTVDENCTIEDISKEIYGKEHRQYFGARINNEIFHLNKKVENNMNIRFIDITNIDGHRIYTKTLTAIYI